MDSRFFRRHGLMLVILSLFIASWIGQAAAGRAAYNVEQQHEGKAKLDWPGYLGTAHFFEATSENWESEFLQMAAFVWLTSFLFQKGSPESKDPDRNEPDRPVTPDSPWPTRKGGIWKALYGYSLSITFFAMFIFSFAIHAWSGSRLYSEELLQRGQAPVNAIQYLGRGQFWFESFENWQSEFLSIAAMVVLGIFLRQQGSPESKDVATPTWENEP